MSGDGPDARDIAGLLNANAQALAFALFPNGKAFGGFFHIGSVEGERGESLKIRLQGSKQGAWADYSRDRSDPAGTGDMLKLVQLTVARGDIKEAIRWSKGWLGLDSMDRGKLDRFRAQAERRAARAEREAAEENEAKRLNAVALWKNSQPMQGTPAQRYLEARGIDFGELGGFPGAIRFRHDVWCSETREKLPAMVSVFVGGLDAQPKAVHITYLALNRMEWRKAAVETAKLIRSPAYMGAHIPLRKGAAEPNKTLRDVKPGSELWISEGIEDGLTVAMAYPAARIVAAGTLGNIGAMQLPAGVSDLVLIGQHDRPGSPADMSLEKQIARHQEAGRKVRCIWPDPAFKDFNDQLRGVRMEGV